MKKYVIGGWVRDKLLGRNPSDKDFVIVGSTPEELIKLGFKPVGKEFPVFLDKAGNEYALARTERKTGNKHTDFEFIFTPNTTLEEDVLRRDLTINSLAIRTEDTGSDNIRDKVIDYVGGLTDLDNHILRAVRPETFVEDSLRVLRLYRFQAQLSDDYTEFTIDQNTEELCRKMIADGMLEHLTPERIWKEIEKALGEGYRSDLFFKGLHKIGALKVILPEIDRLFDTPEKLEFHPSGNSGDHTMIALRQVQDCNPTVKFAVLLHDIAKGTTPPEILPAHYDHDIRGLPIIEEICNRLRVPNYYRKEALIFCKTHMRIIKINTMSLKKQYDLISELSDGFKDSILLSQMQLCFMADYFGEAKEYPKEDIELYHTTISRMNNIYNILYGITVDRLPEEYQTSLARFSGEKFGSLLREYKIRYLKQKLIERGQLLKPHWVIDKYLLDIQNSNMTLLERFEEIFKKHNIEYVITQYIPFSEHNEPIPYSKYDKSTIFYSTIGYNRNAMRDGYHYGIFYDEEKFSYLNYVPYIKDYILNEHASVISWGELKKNWRWEFDGYQTNKLFIRPSAGDKLFAGKLVNYEDMEYKIEYWERENDIPLDTDIIIAPPKDIKSEMRFLIVDGEVITGSQYRYNGILDVRKDYFQGAYDLAEIIAHQDWQLDKAYTCDVAMLEDGSFKVIELNCITCAGMYACDVEKFVLAMNKLIEKENK